MSVAIEADVGGRFLWGSDTSNTHLEWTGHQLISAAPAQATCLPLRCSVRRIARNRVGQYIAR